MGGGGGGGWGGGGGGGPPPPPPSPLPPGTKKRFSSVAMTQVFIRGHLFVPLFIPTGVMFDLTDVDIHGQVVICR